MNQITTQYVTENGACYEQYVITDPAAKTALTITPERGGMITGFTLDGEEYIWTRRPNFSECNRPRFGVPVLFPSCGNPDNGVHLFDGKAYPMECHGFADLCAWEVESVGPDGVSRSVERSAALAAGVMREGAICVTAPEQPKAALSELIVAAGREDCELVVPDPDDITFLEAEKFTSRVDYGGYTVPLAFLGRHAAGSAAIAVETALALCKKGLDIPDEAILEGLAAVENRSSIRVLSQRPLIILDACRTPQQAMALLRVLNMAKVRHLSAVIGLTEEEGAEAFFTALETGLTPDEQKKDKQSMPGMSDSPFDKVFLVTPQGIDDALTERLLEKARYHFDAERCTSLDEAIGLARANSRRGLLICGSEAIALEAEQKLEAR